jgi:hypothetical protein
MLRSKNLVCLKLISQDIRTGTSNRYCRLCFRLRAALLCWLSLSFAACFGLHGHHQVCRILHIFIFICLKDSAFFAKKKKRRAAKQKPLSILK